jgi:hypothetical protein
VATATLNLPEIALGPDEVIIKDYSENEGMLDTLILAGLFSFSTSRSTSVPVWPERCEVAHALVVRRVAIARGAWRVLECPCTLSSLRPRQWKGSLMTSAEQATLDQALALARKLPPSTRAELVARIVRELADVPAVAARRLTPDQARAALADIRAAVQALPQPRQTLGEQLEADRHSRARTHSTRSWSC